MKTLPTDTITKPNRIEYVSVTDVTPPTKTVYVNTYKPEPVSPLVWALIVIGAIAGGGMVMGHITECYYNPTTSYCQTQ